MKYVLPTQTAKKKKIAKIERHKLRLCTVRICSSKLPLFSNRVNLALLQLGWRMVNPLIPRWSTSVTLTWTASCSSAQRRGSTQENTSCSYRLRTWRTGPPLTSGLLVIIARLPCEIVVSNNVLNQDSNPRLDFHVWFEQRNRCLLWTWGWLRSGASMQHWSGTLPQMMATARSLDTPSRRQTWKPRWERSRVWRVVFGLFLMFTVYVLFCSFPYLVMKAES